MKYNENNKPIICMMTQSTCYRQTKTMDVKGILWHSTGADNPWLKRYVQPDDKAAEKEDLIKPVRLPHTYVKCSASIPREASVITA